MAQNKELRLQSSVTTPDSGVAKLWVNNTGQLSLTNSAGVTSIVGNSGSVQDLTIQSSVSNPSAGSARLWTNSSGINLTKSDGTNTFVGGGKRVYRALLSQSSTNPPVARVLENSLTGLGILTWNYNTVGEFHIIYTGAFPTNRTFASANVDWYNGSNNLLLVGHPSDDQINLTSFVDFTGLPKGIIGSNCFFEVTVYP